MDFAPTFLERSRYYLATEYRIKIRAAVESLPDGALWSRPNAESNSVGNLLLHLAGNVRQWIVSGVGGATDLRNRAGEFQARDHHIEKIGAPLRRATALMRLRSSRPSMRCSTTRTRSSPNSRPPISRIRARFKDAT